MRIVANTEFLGPIQVCLHNRWHRVCDFNWTKEDAMVACRQFELEHTGELLSNTLLHIILSTDAVPLYFNEEEVLPEGLDDRRVLNNCECDGSERYYEDCGNSMGTSPLPVETDKIVGALCQDLQK